ncbi:MAG: aminotransferase class I/II-fold pyridoxal phosphate-dependent enzyme [Eubacteriales bacterium]|nr:aminotransferase class I/II-fold pyridoxal phosphate-dependent enzyme [Eubacteriales bacterium]
MKYDFTSIMDRHGKDAAAVDAIGVWKFAPKPPKEGFSFLPMWVADMNFATAPSITEAIMDRVSHPAFGYFETSDEYYDAIIRWQKTHNGVEGLEKKHIGYENGVLGGVNSALSYSAEPGDAILLHSPTYIGFTMTLNNNGYHIVHSPLKQDENGIYRMDFEDMDRKIKEHNIHTAIFCSPHNPTGRAWERWELEKAAEVYERNQVTVICDEIWSDLLLNGNQHIPFQSISQYAHDNTAAFYAPSKTFNLAGLIGSYHIIYNDKMRERIVAHGDKTHYNSMNVLSMHALVGGYKAEGEEWLSQLCQVLSDNVNYACDFIKNELEGVEVTRPEATYMLFIDAGKWCEAHGKTITDVLHAGWEVGVGWQDGVMFHGPTHIRMNLALPHSQVVEAFDRLKKYVFVD